MTDEKNKIQPSGANSNLTTGGKKIGMPLWQRVQTQKAAAQANAVELPNRIGLMLDCSGSMGGEKIEHLRQAYDAFTNMLNLNDTALAVCHFGFGEDAKHDMALTTDKTLIMVTGMGLLASGSTPMAQAMERMISTQPVTRCVLLSDGQPDSEERAYAQAESFKEAAVPVDCVHIGHGSYGEDVLRKIAEMTGGIYIKFSNTENFAKFFSYLTPTGRLRLTSGEVSAEQIGADEIRFLGGK